MTARPRSPQRIRIAALQYFIRPVERFEQFADQVGALVDTARDYDCDLLVFPEYFTVQLLTLGNVKRPIARQVRDLASQVPKFVDLLREFARASDMYIVAGTIPATDDSDDRIYNLAHVFAPDGRVGTQPKLHMTRFESEEWFISPGVGLRLFDTDVGRLAVTVCYDVEFPELARAAARKGADLLIVPTCTDDRQGYLRVRYCAQARAIENQMYVVQACTVGSLPMVPAVSLNYGQAAIMTPSDFPFSRDGILAEGGANQESMVIGELNMRTIEESRRTGTVLPLRDSDTTAHVLSNLEVVPL